MREVISVHVGQAGVQIGNACCEFLLSTRRLITLFSGVVLTNDWQGSYIPLSMD
jgi:hypothetical protein